MNVVMTNDEPYVDVTMAHSQTAVSPRRRNNITSGAERDGLVVRTTPTTTTTSPPASPSSRSSNSTTPTSSTPTKQQRQYQHASSISNDELIVVSRQDFQHQSSDSDFWSTVAGVAGNVLEWYDFAVFGFFGDIIGQVFFPRGQGGDASTMEAFLVFGLAFLARPVGGILMGYIGDVYGPKKALILSIFLMAFPTFAMGCLPSYEQVGALAIVLLVTVRILQGLSVGGQLMSSLCFTLEAHDPAEWGLYGSYVMAAANFGTLLGSLAGTFLEGTLSPEQLVAWGWRLPFLSGIVVSFSGFYLKSHGGDGHHGHPVASPREEAGPLQFTSTDNNNNNNMTTNGEAACSGLDMPPDGESPIIVPKNPIREAFRGPNLRPLAAASLVPMLWSAGFYLSFVWMSIYMKDLIKEPVPNAFAISSMALLFSVCLLFPFAGILSDWYGRKRVMTIGGTSLGVLAPILIWLISRGNSLVAFISQSLLGISLSLWGAPMCAWLVESFEAEFRLTSVAIGYNIAQAAAGGTAPFFATLFVDKIGVDVPGFMLTVLAVISLAGLWVVSPANNPPHRDTHATMTPETNVDHANDSCSGSGSDHGEFELVERPPAALAEHREII